MGGYETYNVKIILRDKLCYDSNINIIKDFILKRLEFFGIKKINFIRDLKESDLAKDWPVLK
jgi:hypothetical protein